MARSDGPQHMLPEFFRAPLRCTTHLAHRAKSRGSNLFRVLARDQVAFCLPSVAPSFFLQWPIRTGTAHALAN